MNDKSEISSLEFIIHDSWFIINSWKGSSIHEIVITDLVIFLVAIKRLYAQKSLAVSALLASVAAISPDPERPSLRRRGLFSGLETGIGGSVPMTSNMADVLLSPLCFATLAPGKARFPGGSPTYRYHFTDRVPFSPGIPRDFFGPLL